MTERRAPDRGLRLIAAFKLLKGLALLALGIGALRLLHKDLAAVVEHWINIFQVDPHSHYIQLLLAKLSIVDDRRLKELRDRKSTRLNSSHDQISYAVFCLKKKKKKYYRAMHVRYVSITL